MGLGLFIAKTLLERTGARVSFANGGGGGQRAAGAVASRDLARGPAWKPCRDRRGWGATSRFVGRRFAGRGHARLTLG
jgi:signal transduction histidine kinase